MEHPIIDDSVISKVVRELQRANGGAPVLVRLVKRKYEDAQGSYRGSFLRYFRENSEAFELVPGRARGQDLVCTTTGEGKKGKFKAQSTSIKLSPKRKMRVAASRRSPASPGSPKGQNFTFGDESIRTYGQLQKKVRELSFQLRVKERKIQELEDLVKDLKGELLMKDSNINELETINQEMERKMR